jgi:transcription-repair coupling factor (superfamily II helicase)
LKRKKEDYDYPNVENKVFRKTEKVFRYISEKTVIFIQNTEDFLAQLDKQFGKAEEAFAKLSQRKSVQLQNNCF